MPWWHFSFSYGGRYKRYKWWQEWKNNEEKEVECPDEDSPVDMEEGVNDINYDKRKMHD